MGILAFIILLGWWDNNFLILKNSRIHIFFNKSHRAFDPLHYQWADWPITYNQRALWHRWLGQKVENNSFSHFLTQVPGAQLGEKFSVCTTPGQEYCCSQALKPVHTYCPFFIGTKESFDWPNVYFSIANIRRPLLPPPAQPSSNHVLPTTFHSIRDKEC